MRKILWVVEESLDNGKTWYALFSEPLCICKTKRLAMEWIKYEHDGPPILYNGVKIKHRVAKYIREEKK